MAFFSKNDKTRYLILILGVYVGKNFGTLFAEKMAISVWRVGDFFLLQDLCKLALDSFKDVLREASWELSIHSGPQSAQEFVREFVDFVPKLYQQGTGDLFAAFRPTTLSFLVSSIHIFSKSREFMNLLHDVPEFSSDWAVVLTNSMGFAKTPPASSNRCVNCQKLGWMYLNRTKWFEKQETKYYCKQCYSLDHLEVQDGKGGDSP